ncbi:MAG: A24 family peptidase [Eubacteriales bacterium]|nr:A24 family peptidase [Eubacteriales bacterium]
MKLLLCFFAPSCEGSFKVVMTILLLVISWVDFQERIIPNELNLALLLLGSLQALVQPQFLSIWERLAGLFLISGIILLVNRLYPGGIGYGDVKLVGSVGFCLGLKRLLWGVIAGSFLAAGVILVLLITRRISLKDKIAFGPYLCAGFLFVLWGL